MGHSLQQVGNVLLGIKQCILGNLIDLGYHNDDRHIEGKGDVEVVDASRGDSFGIHYYQGVVWVMTADPTNHSLDVLLVTSHINKGENLLALFHYLSPRKHSELALVCYDFALGIEAKDLLRNGRCASIQYLVLMSEDICPSLTFAVILFARYQYP